MTWLWVTGGIVLILLLLCMTRVGAEARFGDAFYLDIKVGLFRFSILPGKKSKENMTEPEEQKQSVKTAGNGKKLSFSQIRDLLETLWPPLKKALAKIRRGIRIHPLQLSVIIGGEEDPPKAAELYGYVHGGVWTVMPVLEQLIDIPDPHIHIGLDFTEEKTQASGEIGLSARIGTLLAVVWTVAVPAVKWLMREKRNSKQKLTERTAE